MLKAVKMTMKNEPAEHEPQVYHSVTGESKIWA